MVWYGLRSLAHPEDEEDAEEQKSAVSGTPVKVEQKQIEEAKYEGEEFSDEEGLLLFLIPLSSTSFQSNPFQTPYRAIFSRDTNPIQSNSIQYNDRACALFLSGGSSVGHHLILCNLLRFESCVDESCLAACGHRGGRDSAVLCRHHTSVRASLPGMLFLLRSLYWIGMLV